MRLVAKLPQVLILFPRCLWAANMVERRRASHAIITFGQHTRSNDIGRGIPSSPLGSTDGRTTSAWHVIIAFVRQTRSNDVGHGVPASPLCSTHGRTTSGVACHHRLWAAHTVGRSRAWHAILALVQHTQSNDVGRGMPSSPLVSINGQTTSGVVCPHRLWVAHTVERRRAWRAIIAFGQHIRSIDVGCGMPSSPLGSTHGCTTSGVACHHRLWATHTVERRRVWHAIIAFGQHRRSTNVRRGMPSSPLGCKHGRTTSGLASHHRLWAAHTVDRRRAWHAIIAFGQYTRSSDVGRGMPSSPLGSRHGRTTSGVACHHRFWAAHTVERRRAWHVIIAFGQHTQSNNVRRYMPSSPLGSTQG